MDRRRSDFGSALIATRPLRSPGIAFRRLAPSLINPSPKSAPSVLKGGLRRGLARDFFE